MKVSWSILAIVGAAALLALRAQTMSAAPDQVDAGGTDELDADEDGEVPDAGIPDGGEDADPAG